MTFKVKIDGFEVVHEVNTLDIKEIEDLKAWGTKSLSTEKPIEDIILMEDKVHNTDFYDWLSSIMGNKNDDWLVTEIPELTPERIKEIENWINKYDGVKGTMKIGSETKEVEFYNFGEGNCVFVFDGKAILKRNCEISINHGELESSDNMKVEQLETYIDWRKE